MWEEMTQKNQSLMVKDDSGLLFVLDMKCTAYCLRMMVWGKGAVFGFSAFSFAILRDFHNHAKAAL